MTKAQVILNVLQRGGDWTTQELARELGWTVNRVSGRLSELKQEKRIVESEKRKCRVTNEVVTPVSLDTTAGSSIHYTHQSTIPFT
jgi:predicted transcriptional regulator